MSRLAVGCAVVRAAAILGLAGLAWSLARHLKPQHRQSTDTLSDPKT